jgi:hypothetical protein
MLLSLWNKGAKYWITPLRSPQSMIQNNTRTNTKVSVVEPAAQVYLMQALGGKQLRSGSPTGQSAGNIRAKGWNRKDQRRCSGQVA